MSFNIQRLKELRQSLRLSQVSLAKKAGVPSATIAAIETGRSKKPSYPTVTAIAKALDVDPDELFFSHSA